ncbi:MAG: hypothetical protein AVDCRST_MAG05-3054 [uncultured Rubrobacteraceae bacterium]|uniref:Uncharacterized protein n=1 Tax=uncultured Rubrobacteraceae bacterium TaxID=349277 RepID=A0A6J4T1V4_9ACTN|nr:MAG: hypothetical protein AVDCRST_MAG05-3054 [uncultured Rubrobacteraceae bacterium]
MTGEVGPQRDVPEEGGPDPTEDPILYLADQREEEEG